MPKKDIIIVTGGAGFVGTNLIKLLLKKIDFLIVTSSSHIIITMLEITLSFLYQQQEV